MGRRRVLGVVAAVAVAAAALAAVVLSGVARGTDELLTRGQLDKAVPGCKWWYCAEPVSYGQAAAVSAATHPGYTVQEVDNLPYKEQMALAPQMGRYFGSYTTKLPKAPPPPPPAGPTHEELERQAREFVPAEVAAKAAARNLGVRVEPFETPGAQPSSTEEYYDLALQSLHAIPRHIQQTLQQEQQRVQVRYDPHSRHTSVDVTRGSVMGDPGSFYERKVRGLPIQSLHAKPPPPQQQQRPRYGVLVQRAAIPAHAQSLASAAGGTGVRKQQLAEVGGDASMPTISEIKEGGQAYVDELEAQLAAAQHTAVTAKKVIETLHNPDAQLIPAGFASSDEEAPSFASRRAVVWNSPTSPWPYPVRFPGVVPPPHPAVLQGVPFPAAVPGNPYNTIYGNFVTYGPMKRWAAEDTAEHAYNLSKWRAAILKARIQQAELSQQLMESAANMPIDKAEGQEDLDSEDGEEAKKIREAKLEGEAEGEEKGREEKEEEEAANARTKESGVESAQLASEVAGLKKMLGSVAEQTALALGDLSKKVSTLAQTQKARCKDCQERGGGGAAAAAVEGEKQEQLAAVKRRALTRVVAKRTRFH